MRTEEFLARLDQMGRNPRAKGGGWIARCPGPRHKNDDRHPSLDVTEGTEGILIACGVGCQWDEILEAMSLPLNALFYNSEGHFGKTAPTQPEGIWDYMDEEYNFLFQVLKYRGEDGSKWFKQRRPMKPDDTEADEKGWVWNIRGVKRVLYRLPSIIHGTLAPSVMMSPHIYIVDGEKDADEIRKHGALATCGPGGANKWLPSYVKYFVGKSVIVVKDKDPAGERWAAEVADSLEPGRITTALWVVEARDGKDSYDSLQVNHTLREAFVGV